MNKQRCFTPQQAVTEATRCIMCHDAPCQKGCPAGVAVPMFIRNIKSRNFAEANRTIKQANVMSGVCAKVCPTSEQCQAQCSRSGIATPIQIGKLQEFAAHFEAENGPAAPSKKPATGKKVALIGAGPASMACAFELAREGHSCTIIERKSLPGGLLTYGIPDFRLSKDLVKREVDFVSALGVDIQTGRSFGRDVKLDDLCRDYDAVFLGMGASEPRALESKGLEGVVTALDFLSDYNEGKTKQLNGHVAVIGGGNTAMDAATVARTLGARATIVYRRTEAEMPAWNEEIQHARELGVEFLFLAAPAEVKGTGRINQIVLRRMTLGEPDASGRRRPVEVPGSEFTLDCDLLVYAISQGTPENLAEMVPGVDLKDGLVKVNEEFRTSHAKVYAAGDIVSGGKTVVAAVADGKRAGMAIAKALNA